MVKDTLWLCGQLEEALGWDPNMAADVVAMLEQCNTKQAMDEIVMSLMGGNAQAQRACDLFWASMGRAGGQKGKQPSPRPGPAAADTSPGPASAGSSGAQPTSAGSNDKVLGIFKQGGRIKQPASKSGIKPGGEQSSKPAGGVAAGRLERMIVNCLDCGKIYDCRNNNNPDIIKFLGSSGVCTFCGSHVSLTYRTADGTTTTMTAAAHASAQQQQQQEEASSSGAAGGGGGGSSSGQTGDAATQAAVAFKNRLIQFDRESAKRTTVIDDQSDFFEVDTNSWLTDAERKQLRERRRIEEAAAEAARKNRVTYTIDLLGRRVLTEAVTGLDNGQGVSFLTRDDQMPQPAADQSSKSRMWDAPAGAVVTGGGGGGQQGVGGATAAVKQGIDGLRALSITANPFIATGAPKYVPAGGAAAAGGKAGAGGHKVASAVGKAGEAGRKVQAASRLQSDLAEIFQDFGTQVLNSDVQQAIDAAELTTFDICPPEYQGTAPMTAPKALPRCPKEVTDLSQLPPGMVLLRGWLSLQDQIDVINLCRSLGNGEGGFYRPSYGTGHAMHLHMMCLGWHWEPRLRSYERQRSAHDGATPPPIPTRLLELCDKALAAANQQSRQSQQVQLPPLKPDICLVNFYTKEGRLGMHQDKDESMESLRRGRPVVSFSIGDAADFMFSMTHDEVNAPIVRLLSGDVLVFGGPARLVYHSVPVIHAGSAPTELLAATGLRPGRLNLTFRQL